MKLLVTMTQDEDGTYVAELPQVPGCVGQGPTEEEAMHDVQQALQECLAVRRERGVPLFVTTREIEVAV